MQTNTTAILAQISLEHIQRAKDDLMDAWVSLTRDTPDAAAASGALRRATLQVERAKTLCETATGN
jgi:hypothetical protein